MGTTYETWVKVEHCSQKGNWGSFFRCQKFYFCIVPPLTRSTITPTQMTDVPKFHSDFTSPSSQQLPSGGAKFFLSTFSFHPNGKISTPFEAAATLDQAWKILLDPPWRLGHAGEKVKLFLNEVEKHFKEKECHHLKFFAKQLHLSIPKLSAICQKELGCCPKKCIKYRISLEAVRMMEQDGDLQIQEIAVELGFDDSSYFSRYFKDNTGWQAKKLQDLLDSRG